MASRKIIFLVIVGILGLLLILGIVKVANKQEVQKNNKLASLSIWVVGGTTEDYWKVFAGFKAISPEYANTVLDIRVFQNYSNYRDILLTTLADGNGPDIFMIEGGGDDVLVSKSIPVPEPYINLSNFDKRFEDIFLPLMQSQGEGKSLVRSILGAPLGYETLGVFYNKNYFPTVPKTWNEIGLLYLSNKNFFPVNIGLGPLYTPDATDIIAYFLQKNGINSTNDLLQGSTAVAEYLMYGTTTMNQGIVIQSGASLDELTPVGEDIVDITDEALGNTTDAINSVLPGSKSLSSFKQEYDETGYSTLDSFIQGKIGMVIGFPSTVREIEKAQKRAGQAAVSGLILTERLPQSSVGEGSTNIARYRYLALSAKSPNSLAGADFIAYLLSESTLALTAEAFPYLISPDRSISQNQGQKSLSTVFARARLDAFIPSPGETLKVYDYGIKSEYEKIFENYLDRNDKIDINNLLLRIKDGVICKLETSIGGKISDNCLK